MKILGLANGTQLVTGLAVGAAVILLAPVLLPVISGMAKSLTKAGIKGGLIVLERGKVALAEARESIEDLTAEAKAEMAEEQTAVVVPKRKRAAAGTK